MEGRIAEGIDGTFGQWINEKYVSFLKIGHLSDKSALGEDSSLLGLLAEPEGLP